MYVQRVSACMFTLLYHLLVLPESVISLAEGLWLLVKAVPVQ